MVKIIIFLKENLQYYWDIKEIVQILERYKEMDDVLVEGEAFSKKH